jgi:hypothetical protein
MIDDKTNPASCSRLRGTLLAAALTAVAALAFAPSALAAPALGLNFTHSPSVVSESDFEFTYVGKVKNVGDTVTSGTTLLSVDLPAGVNLREVGGTGWTCSLTGACNTSSAVAAGAEYPPVTFKVNLLDAAPGTIVSTAATSGGGAVSEVVAQDTLILGPPVPFGLKNFFARANDESGAEYFLAGGHPFEAVAHLEFATNSSGAVPERFDEIVTRLPVGFVGNPLAVPAECKVAELTGSLCPEASAIGQAHIITSAVPSIGADKNSPVFRIAGERGAPAAFGFEVFAPHFFIRGKVRSDGDYGLTVIGPHVPQQPEITFAEVRFCQYGAKVSGQGSFQPNFDGCREPGETVEPGSAPPNPKPLLTNTTRCSGEPPVTDFAIDTWEKPGRKLADGSDDPTDPTWRRYTASAPLVTGCEALTEAWVDENEPSFSFQPDTRAADTPAGYTARLHVPQPGLHAHDELATSHLKDITVTLPEGISLNPSAADGISACTEEQMGLKGTDFPDPNPIRFNLDLPNCPSGSKIGNAKVETPLLEEPLTGSIYLAAQKDNPFDSNFAIYLAIEEEETGVIVKLAGKVAVDPGTGRITTTFTNNPQLPFEDLTLEFFGKGRGALANPVSCGTFETGTEMTPWSAKDPHHPESGEIARPVDEVQIDSGPDGSACVDSPSQRPFDIGLTAGAKDPVAGARSPFAIRITRPDGAQEFDRLEISPPPGFVASLKGIPYCSEAQIQAAAAGSGRTEQSNSSCPPASQIGTTNAAAGAGPTPYYASGKLYLAGPYKGETLSVVAVTPAVAGPFDLGNVVIRSALQINPLTARITAVTDPIPQIVEGVPLRIRDIRINLDRPNWAQNPTSCEAMAVDVTAFGSNGAVSKPSNRFQVGGCERLGFKPKLRILLKGGTRRGDHPALLATLKTRPGDANIARAAVTLPPSAFLDQGHIRTICTRVQFAADQCPKGAVYGYAKATTSLLDDPIEGRVFLRSSDNKLPDLVGTLRGVANIEAVGRIDSVKGGIRNTFDVIPDAPFDVFTLRMQGGSKGLVVNSRDLCATTNRATVKFTAHNGKHYNYRPEVIATGCKKAAKKSGDKRKRGERGVR